MDVLRRSASNSTVELLPGVSEAPVSIPITEKQTNKNQMECIDYFLATHVANDEGGILC